MTKIIKLVFLFILIGPSGLDARSRDHLVIGITQFPSTFHPNIDSMLAKSYILAMTRRPFTIYDANWKNICMLCSSLPTIENGLAKREITPDGKKGIAVTFSIHPEAKWGDGVSVTTKDVIFTWKVGRHSKSGVGNKEFYRSLYKIDALDEKTFTMHFDKFTFKYNSIGGFELLPAHIEEKNFVNPVNYKYQTAFDGDSNNPGLYFGPYRIIESVSGSHVVLVPNPSWYGVRPYFKKITVRVIENTAALEANLLSGGIDMIAGELGLTVDQAVNFERRYGTKYQIIYKPSLAYEHIDLNLDNPILADRRVRRALIHSINRTSISQKLFGGRQPVAHTSVNPLDWVYAQDAPEYRYNPKKAKQLLNESGWRKMKEGIRLNARGEPLRLEIMTTAGNRSRELVQQVMQSQWRELGFDVRIRNQTARVFFGKTIPERNYAGMAMYAWISSPESVPRTTLHSAHIPNSSNNFVGQNYTGFKNKEMDKLLEVIETELSREKRKKLWRKLQFIYASELPVIPLFFRANAYIIPNWLTGLIPTGHQYPSTHWVEHWKPNP